jgi:hypothetical protein
MKVFCGWRMFVAGVIVSLGLARPVTAIAADDDVTAMVQRRVQDWQATGDERLFDKIGWAGSLVEAQQLARQHTRPVFVFTYNGSTTRINAIALQRC